MSHEIMREFGVDLRLRDSENMGPTRSEAKMVAEIERLRTEVNEQARLLGMSGSREAALLARLADLEAEHAAFSNNVEQCEAENDRLRARLAEAEAACRLLVQWDDAENNALPFADDNGAGFYARVALCRRAMDAARSVAANAALERTP